MDPGEGTTVINTGAIQSCPTLLPLSPRTLFLELWALIYWSTYCCELKRTLRAINIYFWSQIFSQQACAIVPSLYLNSSCFHGGTIPVQSLHRVRVIVNPNAPFPPAGTLRTQHKVMAPHPLLRQHNRRTRVNRRLDAPRRGRVVIVRLIFIL